MRKLSVLVILLVLTSYSHAQDTADGRWLPDGTWQPRNKNASIEIPYSYESSVFPHQHDFTDNIIIGWEPDTRLSYGNIMAFYSGVVEGGAILFMWQPKAFL